MRRLSVFFLCLILLSGCTRVGPGLYIAGSTSVQPMAEMLAEAYAEAGGGRVSIQGGGSTAGVQAVLTGIAAVGAISRRLTPEETSQGLVEHVIGYDVLTVVVHPSNPLIGLMRVELQRLYDGQIGNWAQLGGRPGPVHLVTREAGSGSREAFRSLVGGISPRAIVQNSSGAIRVAVMQDPWAVGYISLGVAQMGGLKVLRVNGVQPGDLGYPLIRPLSLVTRGVPVGEAAAFVRFALSPRGQAIIRAEGMVPVSHEP